MVKRSLSDPVTVRITYSIIKLVLCHGTGIRYLVPIILLRKAGGDVLAKVN